MKELTQEDILNLPVHDSDLLGFEVYQQDNGNTEVIIKIAFYPEEFEDLPSEYSSYIDPEGRTRFLFKNCYWVNLGFLCNTTQRDCIDFIQLLENSPKVEEFHSKQDLKHVEINFVSGSKLECIAEIFALT